MPSTIEDHQRSTTQGLPHAGLLKRTRDLILWTLAAALVYGFFTVASKGICLGGVTADGGFLDAAGNPTEITPQCVHLTLQPNPLVFVALAVIVAWTLTVVLRTATTEEKAIRSLNRSAVIIGVTVAVCVVISQVWFGLIPIGDWDGTTTNYLLPFPFGSVTVDITPMNG